jgi:hypothetical protein
MSTGSDAAAISSATSPSMPARYSSQPTPEAFGPLPPTMGAQAAPSILGAGRGPFDNGTALAVAPQMESSTVALDVDAVRQAVLEAMETGGSQLLHQALEEGHWSGRDKQVSIQVGMSAAMIELSYTKQQEKLSNQAASRVAGRTIHVRLVAGSSTELKPRQSNAPRAATTDSIKTKAADEPVVKRMMEKFGAEIRIVMDRTER